MYKFPPKYHWNEEAGIAGCTIEDEHGNKFYGGALCHPDDEDMKSKLAGQTIAEMRAMTQALRFKRDNELKPQLRVLKQLYYAMNRSKHFNPKSYENYMLYRQIRRTENDLATIKQELVQLKQSLSRYLSDKEICHAKLRKAKDN